MNKENEFFTLAKKMNEQLAIIPLLFGSVALNMLVEDDVYMGDIDIAVPHYMRPDRKWICPNIVKLMENEHYEFTDMWEGEFHKGDIMIHIAGNNVFMEYADIDVTVCPIIQTGGAIYKILTLEQQFNSYTVSAECDFRQRDKNEEGYINADRMKAEITRRALERTK